MDGGRFRPVLPDPTVSFPSKIPTSPASVRDPTGPGPGFGGEGHPRSFPSLLPLYVLLEGRNKNGKGVKPEESPYNRRRKESDEKERELPFRSE